MIGIGRALDGARDAAEALRAVGATGANDIFTRALAVFGRAGPAADRDARHEQVSRIAANAAKVLAPQERGFSEDQDCLPVKLELFAARHPEDFGGPSG
jgi:hypothetical protein